MVKLTLADGRVIDFKNVAEHVQTEKILVSLFSGDCSVREGKNAADCTDDYLMVTNELWRKVETEYRECYVVVESAKWTFAETPFAQYVQDWMNKRGIEDVFKFLNARYPARFGALFFPLENREHATVVLIRYLDEIESMINEMTDGMGLEFYYVFFETKRVGHKVTTGASQFKVSTLPIIAFEERLRRVMYDLDIGW